MKPLKLIGILLLAILTTFALSTGAWAKKGGKPDGGTGGTDEAVFHVEITGAFTGSQDSRPQSVKPGTKSVIFSPRQGIPMKFHLEQFWADQAYAGGSNGSECFGDLIIAEYVNGSLHLNEFEGSQIGIAAFWFTGGDDDPNTDTEIKYVIEFHDVSGLGWDSGANAYEFPPVNHSLSLTPETWEMRTEGRGELNKGPCVGMGSFGDAIPKFSLNRVN